jgi:hypothetical protein
MKAVFFNKSTNLKQVKKKRKDNRLRPFRSKWHEIRGIIEVTVIKPPVIVFIKVLRAISPFNKAPSN